MENSDTWPAVLFADVSGSARLYERLGDESARQAIAACLALLSNAAVGSGGEVIKTIGDEAMCLFPDTGRALTAAAEMHRLIEAAPGLRPEVPAGISIHVGIHAGPVIRERRDVFGDSVNLAARMAALAKPRQILMTEPAVLAMGPGHDQRLRYLGSDAVKGKSGEYRIYEYLWEDADATVMLEPGTGPLAGAFQLELRNAGRLWRVDRQRPEITLGRHPHNDMVLGYERVSRFHARIAHRRGKFALIDHSANGTHVQISSIADIHLKRDEAVLAGRGVISLGRKASPRSPGAIHFKVSLIQKE
jgi:adenylate cyclase